MEILIISFLGLLILGGAFITWTSSWWGLIFSSLGIILLFKSFKRIPADPPNIGLVTIWGGRTGATKKEGWCLLAPYFPFLQDIILINMTKKNKDFPFKNVRCVISTNVKTDAPDDSSTNVRSGGSVEVIVSITWIPDKKRLIAYVNSGSQSGVEQIISDKMAEVIRQMGRTHNWEEMTFATNVMSANLIISIVGIDNVKGSLVNPGSWEWGDKIGEQIPDDDIVKAMDFLQKALIDGVADSHDLGIKIRRLNIKQVEPEGELRQDAEKSAREVQERRAEVFELSTEIQLAEVFREAYKKADTPKSLEECVMEVRRRKVMREGHGKVIDIAGLSPELIAAATRLLRR